MTRISHDDIRKHYDAVVVSKYDGRYESNRWHATARYRLDYSMTEKSLRYHIRNISYRDGLELGPGPGTWTSIFLGRCREANFHLVDISEEMRKQFVAERRESSKIKYSVGDFMDLSLSRVYDFFVSVRALEYFSDKQAVCQKISDALKNNAAGIIVTKNPGYGFRKNRDDRFQHSNKILPTDLTSCLQNAGFSVDGVYPVIIRIPILDRFTLLFSRIIYGFVYRGRFSRLISPFAESYITVFHKP
jgi:SAM-dependent methyltransferase